MKIVITGGCGYIGSHIARAIKKHDKNNKIFIIDRVRRDHTLKGTDGFLHSDFASKQSTLWIEELEPNVVIHCAGDISVNESVSDPAKYYDNNVSKTITMLSVLKNLRLPPLVLFSSSASVYGNPERLPLIETDPINPISPYGYTKAAIERVLQDYNRAYELPSVCFRYFNAAGAEPFNNDLGQEPGAGHIIARVLEAKLKNQPFTLNGNDYNTPDKTCIRDYIHVWDLAEAHIRAIEWNINKQAAIFNLGTNNGISNQEIIDYVIANYGPLDILVGPRRAGDPDKLIADSTRALTELNWRPLYSTIDQIVDSAYKWYTRTNV
jgi:UDP-glucose 4-epimerase